MMDIMQWIVANGGGLMGVASFVLFFRETKRIKNSEAAKGEWDMWERQLAYADAQMSLYYQKLESLKLELRQEQKTNLELTQEINDLKLKLKWLEIYRCEVVKCLSRKPQGDYKCKLKEE